MYKRRSIGLELSTAVLQMTGKLHKGNNFEVIPRIFTRRIYCGV